MVALRESQARPSSTGERGPAAAAPGARAALLVVALLLGGCSTPGGGYAPRNGDIIFQTSTSAQSVAIQKATRSPYSHMGIVYLSDGQAFVFEAVEPVRSTPLDRWIARGQGGHFAVKRLRDADSVLTPRALRRMLEVGRAFEGRHYDPYFEWSDDRIYCSELVWKVYKRALGVELGRLQHMREFDLTDPLVRAKVRERWGAAPPAGETVISPAAIFGSRRLVTAYTR